MNYIKLSGIANRLGFSSILVLLLSFVDGSASIDLPLLFSGFASLNR